MSILNFGSHKSVQNQTTSMHTSEVRGNVSYVLVYLCVHLPYVNHSLTI